MEPVSNVDRLVLILRERLRERSGAVRTGGRSTARAANASSSGLRRVQELAAVESVPDRQLKRALIQGLLSEQFGGQMINEARFQQVVDRVTETIDADREGGKLLSRIVRELRASAG